MVDIVAVVGIMSFLLFVSFCYMTAGWHNGDDKVVSKSGVEAAITFSFFSVCVFVSMPFLKFLNTVVLFHVNFPNFISIAV